MIEQPSPPQSDQYGNVDGAPPEWWPIGGSPINVEAIRREIETQLKSIDLAADGAELKSHDPYRYMTRVSACTVRASSAMLCMLITQIRIASDDLLAQRAQESEIQGMVSIRTARAMRSCVGAAVLAIVTVFLTCLFTLSAQAPRSATPSAEVVFDSSDTGLISCPPKAEDAAGDFHCSMTVVLKKRRTKH